MTAIGSPSALGAQQHSANAAATVAAPALACVAHSPAASTTAMVQNLGIAVRQLREKQGWSQEELAERSGLNRSYVGEIERGKVVASVVTAHKLAYALSVSIVELFAQSDAIARMRSRLWRA